MSLQEHNTKEGYVALLSVLIVSAIAAATVLIVLTTSLNTTLNSGDISEGTIALTHANGCAERALQRLTNGSADPCPSPCRVPLSFVNTGQCTIVEISATDAPTNRNWRIRATGSGMVNAITKYIEVNAYRHAAGSATTVLSWKEVNGTGF